jgi:hypothetical protein
VGGQVKCLNKIYINKRGKNNKMGIRGIIKDILFVYLGYMIISLAITGEKVTTAMVFVTILIFILIGWFMLERVGLMDKM